MVATWRPISSPAPAKDNEMATVTITAIVMVTLRRRPLAVSATTNWARTSAGIWPGIWPGSSARKAVDPPGLVADHRTGVQLDHATAHRVDDGRVVGGHDEGGAGPVDPVEQIHDAHAGARVEVAGRLVRQEDQRPVDERPGDGDSLLLTAG